MNPYDSHINQPLAESEQQITPRNVRTLSASEPLIIKFLWLRRNAFTIGGEAVLLVTFSDKT